MERSLLFNCCIVCIAFHVSVIIFMLCYVKVTAGIKKIWTIEFELISADLCDQEVTDFQVI